MMYIDTIKKKSGWWFMLFLTLGYSCLSSTLAATSRKKSSPPKYLNFILPSMEEDDDEKPLQVIWKEKKIPLGAPVILKAPGEKEFILVPIPIGRNNEMISISANEKARQKWLYIIPAPYQILAGGNEKKITPKRVKGAFIAKNDDPQNCKLGNDYSVDLIVPSGIDMGGPNFLSYFKQKTNRDTISIVTITFTLYNDNPTITGMEYWQVASKDLKNKQKSKYRPGLFYSTLEITKKLKKKMRQKQASSSKSSSSSTVCYTKIHKGTKTFMVFLFFLLMYVCKWGYDQQFFQLPGGKKSHNGYFERFSWR